MSHRRRASAVLLVAALCANAAAAETPIAPQADSIDLASNARFLLDERRTLTPPAILALPDAALRPFAERERAFGITGAALWMRTSVRARSARQLTLVFDSPLVEELDVYVEGAGRHEHHRGGLFVAPETRDIAHRGAYHALPLAFAADEEATILVRATNRRSLYGALALWDPTALARRDGEAFAFLAFDAGVLAVVLALALYRYGLLRDAWSSRLVALFGCYGLFQASTLGLLAAAVWPRWPRWGMASSTLLAGLSISFLLAYARSFTDSSRRRPGLDRAARIVQRVAWATGASALVAAGPPEIANALVALVAFALTMLLGADAVLRGDRSARWFLVGWSIVAAFAAGLVAANLGLAPANWFTLRGLHVAVWLAAVLFFIGLADRHELASATARDELEGRVAARTRELAGTVGQLRAEVAEREAAEQLAQESEERFRRAFQTVPDALTISDAATRVFLEVNEGFSEVTGYSPVEAIGRTPEELGLWRSADDAAAMGERLAREGSLREYEVALRRRDGGESIALVSGQRMTLRGRELTLMLTRDVTARRRAEEERSRLQDQLRQSQKLEAIGLLGGGIAHDFNNMMTVVINFATFLLDDLPAGSPMRDDLLQIKKAAERATQLTRQLLAFSRKQVMEPSVVQLNHLVTEMDRMLRALTGDAIELSLRLAPELPPVLVDPGQLGQVLVNLAVNARDAMPRGGRLIVETGIAHLDGVIGASHVDLEPGTYVVLAATDTGVGMDEETRRRATEPFFTTKGGQGTGLGLSTVYGIVRQFGGHLSIESAPGRGASFKVFLPPAPDSSVPAAPTPARADDACVPAQGETILLVEDEELVRNATRAVLERCGYRVLAAADGAEAERLARRDPGPIHLLLTDMSMPRMDGPAVARRLSELRPGLRVLFMSGYAENAGSLAPDADFIQKPFTQATLSQKLRDVLARPAASSKRSAH